ncbi:hypothetical protein M0L20_07940 [Spirosoma sp. RP8]|uniref:Uncharacterized protein n=1 Tax=Spirosoma liriopis TaxID=2937440 RepID=A0ABT0HJL2_9BACT|nr:hypothetical protein [Spirosoma liriopis]MCK8491780.1 hypothetical protein [Spirosoma liriopis]
MEERDNVDTDYLKGFNEGYTMALYMPDFAEKIVSMDEDNSRNAGFKAGREQLLAEKQINKNILPAWLRSNRYDDKDQQTPDKSKDQDKDLDIEPEMN